MIVIYFSMQSNWQIHAPIAAAVEIGVLRIGLNILEHWPGNGTELIILLCFLSLFPQRNYLICIIWKILCIYNINGEHCWSDKFPCKKLLLKTTSVWFSRPVLRFLRFHYCRFLSSFCLQYYLNEEWEPMSKDELLPAYEKNLTVVLGEVKPLNHWMFHYISLILGNKHEKLEKENI